MFTDLSLIWNTCLGTPVYCHELELYKGQYCLDISVYPEYLPPLSWLANRKRTK